MKNLKVFLLRAIYLALACAMFYFTNEDSMTVGGIGVMHQYLFAIVIVGVAFIVFLVQPDSHRMAVALRYGGVLSTHYLWIELYSMLIWGLSLSPAIVIRRGSFFVVYELI